MAGSRRPVVGHVITIVQSLFAALHDEEGAEHSLDRSSASLSTRRVARSLPSLPSSHKTVVLTISHGSMQPGKRRPHSLHERGPAASAGGCRAHGSVGRLRKGGVPPADGESDVFSFRRGACICVCYLLVVTVRVPGTHHLDRGSVA